jgi:hypothetical protein
MNAKIVEFCGLLRQNGLRVSVSETMDALRALGTIGIDDRESVRAALRATAVKRAIDVPTFERIFDLYFSGMGEVIKELTEATRNSLELDPAAFQKMLEDLERFLEEQGSSSRRSPVPSCRLTPGGWSSCCARPLSAGSSATSSTTSRRASSRTPSRPRSDWAPSRARSTGFAAPSAVSIRRRASGSAHSSTAACRT